MKNILFLVALSAFLGCCDQFTRKNSNTDTHSPGFDKNDITIRYINKKTGESKDYGKIDTEGLINLISDLLIQSEPVRVHLDEIEIDSLFNENSYWEISFAKPFISESQSLGISKFVYFLAGIYGNEDSANVSYFFIATDDGQFIQSPFVAEKNTKKEFEKYLADKP